ncbi:MAG: hypothetical protein VYA34_05480, partial [Myxococcota bacterium]|nr:hypothetical protein [Myxococcota bacterium]
LAQREFKKLLYLAPNYHLDPYSVPPPIIEAFETIRQQLMPKLDTAQDQREQGMDNHLELKIKPLYSLTQHSAWLTLLPFGIGQFQNGNKKRGIALAITQAVFLGINIGSYLTNRYSIQNPKNKQRWVVAQYLGLTLFGLSWSLGIFEARINFTPYIIQQNFDTPPTGGGKALDFQLNLNLP